ncbi:MAG: 16S rRNA processing protein RimM [Desulfobulbaceae bacterium]|nr:16S rRNA processing protein RimM [Desulfobulbaceae bacterium]
MSREFNYPTDRYLLIGRVGKPHGLRGEFKLICFSGQPESILSYTRLVLVDKNGNLSGPLVTRKSRVQGKNVVIALETINDRDQVEAIVGVGVLVAKEDLPETGENEYYWHHLEGQELVDLEGNIIGTVASLFNNGAQDILVVSAGSEEVLIPVTKEIVVGENDGALIINPPPGLLELNKNSGN